MEGGTHSVRGGGVGGCWSRGGMKRKNEDCDTGEKRAYVIGPAHLLREALRIYFNAMI